VNELDYAVIALMVISIVVGVVRGAIREVINIASWIVAFMLARAFAPDVAIHFADWMAEPAYRMALAWLTIFLAVLVVAGLLASLLSELVRKLGLSGLDRTLGAMIGILRGGLAILVLTLVAGMTKVPQTNMWKSAASTPWLEVVAMHARGVLPESLASRISYRSPAVKAVQVTAS
jgi:membrane protein required for colicin V production